MDILSIGNSFSHDAQRYLHDIARCDKVELNTFNLFVGGCTLSRHYRNMLSDQAEYTLDMNGHSTGFKVSMKEALLSRDWDVVTVQQASIKSPFYETYQPYLGEIVEFVRKCAPKAKIVIHQTWAYEQDSRLLNAELGYAQHTQMFSELEAAYKMAFDDTGADVLIPSGKLFQMLIAEGIDKVHRDTSHASLGIGRYALGLLWYKALVGGDVTQNSFSDFDEEISGEDVALIKKCVDSCAVCKR